jgi:hypothetical protein
LKTYQEFEKYKERGQELDFIKAAISEYRASDEYKIAVTADEYEAERNTTIMDFMRWLYNEAGMKVVDFTAANNRVASNFLHRLTTQRVAYSLGNGISFANAEKVYQNGQWVTVDSTKEKLGQDFDTILYTAGRYARLHRVCYLFWNLDHCDYFKATEFCPLFDEYDGSLRAGIRFWSLDWEKRPATVVLYEADGYTKYRSRKDTKGVADLVEYEPKRAYKQKIAHNDVDPDEVVGESNYISIPIIPFWGSQHRQSDLVGMRSKIDALDLIVSGFCNDLQDCAQVYWIIGNAMGMTDADLSKFRDKLKLHHIAVMDTDNSDIQAYQQEIPTAARTALITSLRAQLYEDYGGLDVHTVAAGATNDHIDAAYQPMDEEADDFEYQVIKAVRGILNIIGIDDMPIFQRNRLSNRMEQTQMVMMAANYLDDETVIRKLPFITPDEVEGILARKLSKDTEAFEVESEEQEEDQQEESPEEEPEV